ncbi:MAG: hypothetical protein AABZ64_09590 [Nitrospinota bacterium]
MEEKGATAHIPVICIDPASGPAFQVFNRNDWEGDSRGVIQSCATELSVLRHGSARIESLCASAMACCRPHFERLGRQWDASPWPLDRMIYFAEIPEMHILIEAFFSGVKSLLDLTVQLLFTERVVSLKIDGFHRDKDKYGGRVLLIRAQNV